MSVTGIIGSKGSGKSLMLAIRLYKHSRNGMKVYSNMKLSFPYERITSGTLKAWAKGEVDLSDSAIGVTEIQNFLDARSGWKNRTTTYVILQMRKARCHFIWDTQKIRQVDVRLRENTDYYIVCKCIAKWPRVPRGEEVFQYTVYDTETGKSIGPITIKGKNYYPLYDTFERILDFGVDEQKETKTKRTVNKRHKKAPKQKVRNHVKKGLNGITGVRLHAR